MPQEFRVGIVGPASSYTLHFGAELSKMPGVRLMGLAHLDRDPEYIRDSLALPWLTQYPKTLEGMAEAFRCPLYREPEEMIDAGKLDGVCITTEDSLRRDYTLRAIKKGMHVFVPKPWAYIRKQADEMLAAARERGVKLIPQLPIRWRAPYVAARQVIDEGLIGRPLSGHFAIDHHLTLGGWKSDPSMSAGPEFELGFYTFDLLRWLIKGEATRVYGVGVNLDHGGVPYIDNGKGIIDFENGAIASIDLRFSMHHPYTGGGFEVIGNEGALILQLDPATNKQVIAVYKGAGVEKRAIAEYNAVKAELGNWIDICLNDKDATPWQEEGLKTLDLISGFVASCKSGAPVCLCAAQGG
jgi:predicted dehydrogenase